LRTLVVSDLHLGARVGRDVLRHPPALEALLAAIDDIDRLVLLGDVVELAGTRPRQAMLAAEPVLRAMGERLGAAGEVVVVPGNHDALLVRAWVRRRDTRLTHATEVPRDASPLLAQLTGWLAPARATVHYPGVWLDDRIWATHGHYLDRHLLPQSAYGVARGLLGRRPADHASPADYERVRRPSVTRLEGILGRLLPRPVARAASGLTGELRARTMPAVKRQVVRKNLAPLTSRLLSVQMRHAAMPALAHVVERIGVDADWVIFGHVHRCGPLADDDPAQWTGAGDRPRILNSGSWVYEPRLLHRVTPPNPYWPGGAVLLEPGAEPRAVGLLDHLAAEDMR
jgi:UDP-2,3-diacylglucosamine pyrophosphatase LpxH